MATPGALKAFAATGENLINYVVRHMNPDPGDLGGRGSACQLARRARGTRVFSAYELRDGIRIWITEADRSVTTILLPEQY